MGFARREAAMINGAHIIIYSKDADADKAFFRDVLKFKNVDAGNGRLIFALPKTESMLHEAAENDRCELYLIADDLNAEIASLKKAGVACAAVEDEGWGIVTHITLPGGGTLGLYQPKHARP
jgi:predicted enzyme related to lactoylglutathione lyase